MTESELRALIPAAASGGPSNAEYAEFLAAVRTHAGLGSGLIEIEKLVDVIATYQSVEVIEFTTEYFDRRLSLADLVLAAPSGLSTATVSEWLSSIDRSPGGRIDESTARAALFDFIARDGNRGAAETRGVFAFDAFENGIEVDRRGDQTPVEIVVRTGIYHPANSFPPIAAVDVSTGDTNFSCGASGNCFETFDRGGDISITNRATIVSESYFDGDQATGIAARSIGGDISIVNAGIVAVIGEDSEGVEASTHVSSLTSDVTISNSGLIVAHGDSATGIDAESSGRLDVTNSGSILADGDFTVGVRAEGEGNRRSAVTVSNSGLIELGANGVGIGAVAEVSPVAIDNSGRISIAGSQAVGIAAFTGSSDISIRSSGDVQVGRGATFGIVAASGGTDAPAGRIAIEITGGTVRGGSATDGVSVTGDAPEGAAAIVILGGRNNSLTNDGTVKTSGGAAIYAFDGEFVETQTEFNPATGSFEEVESRIVIAPAELSIVNTGSITGDIVTGNAADTLVNEGTISGNAEMGGGANTFENRPSGIFNSRDHVDVGTGNRFENAGILNPGGLGAVKTTTVIGNFVQTAEGRLIVDIDERTTEKSDRIIVTGSADLAGVVVPNVVDLGGAEQRRYLIVDAGAGATDNGLAVDQGAIAVSDTLAYEFDVSFDGLGNVFLLAEQRSIDSIVAGAQQAQNAGNSENLGALGGALSDAEEAGDSGMQPLFSALRLQASTPEQAARSLARLMPHDGTQQAVSSTLSGLSLGNAMFSCAERDGVARYTREGQCYYARVAAQQTNTDVTSSSTGSEEIVSGVTGGVQVALFDQVRLGLAAGYEDISRVSFDRDQRLGESDGDRVSLGVVLKNQWGPFNSYLNLIGSYASLDHERNVGLGNGLETAEGEQDVWSGAARLRLSHLREMGPSWYLKSLVDFSAVYVDQGAYTEHGAGGANLRVSGHGDWIFSLLPGIEIGSEIVMEDGLLVRPFMKAGLLVLDDDSSETTASFLNAPDTQPFVVTGSHDQAMIDIEGGAVLLTPSGVNVRLDYSGRFGEDTRQYGGSVKLTAPF